jgi:hypothetical protein
LSACPAGGRIDKNCACKTERHAFRVIGYGIGAAPVLLRLGVLPAVAMLVFLYGFTFAVRYIQSMFEQT